MIDYLAAARVCSTENQFNRLHIDLEGKLAPTEIAAIHAASNAPDFPPASHAWLESIGAHSPTLFRVPEPFERVQLHKHLVLYRGSTARRRDKRLLIAFTGIARRLMIPTAAFLQSLDAREWDVVLVRNAGSYLDGARELADDLDGLMTYIRRAVGSWAYRSVSVFGVSSGGGPAAIAARRIGARRGLSMCGAGGERLLGQTARPHWRAALMLRKTEVRYVHGVNNAIDAANAVSMAAAWGGKVLPVDGVRSHNVMGSLLKRGLLKGFLAEAL